jgi:hypothetical protein
MHPALVFTVLCISLPYVISISYYSNAQTPAQLPFQSVPQIPFTGSFESGKMDPSLKFGPTYTQQLRPFGNTILLSPRQAQNNQIGKYRAVVVAVGLNADQSIPEGSIVTIDPSSDCLDTFKVTDLANAYMNPNVITSLITRYKHGVSLNNAAPPIYGSFGFSTSPLFPIQSPTFRPQYNYVLCPAAAVVGIVTAEIGGINGAEPGTLNVLKPGFAPFAPDFWTYQ